MFASCTAADSHRYGRSAVRAVNMNEIALCLGLHDHHRTLPPECNVAEDVPLNENADIVPYFRAGKAGELFQCRIGNHSVIVLFEDPVVFLRTVHPSLEDDRRESKYRCDAAEENNTDSSCDQRHDPVLRNSRERIDEKQEHQEPENAADPDKDIA